MELAREAVDLLLSERFSAYRTAAAVVGSLVVLRFSLKFLSGACRWLRAYFLAPWGIGRTDLKKYGPWAIVTGASEGIGRGYALELARQGLNVVLMSRSQEKLDRVADEIKEKYNREVRVVPVDFSHGAEIYPQLAESVEDLDIGILVNNVGLSSEHPDYFLEIPIERQRKMIELNIQATVHMIHYIMPKMVARKRGIVVNLSSVAAFAPPPFSNVYASTKVFVEFFTASLSLEYASKGIIFQTVAPGYVATAMSGVRQSLTVADANAYARSALATVGIMDYTNGYLPHAVMFALLRTLPGFISGPVFRSVFVAARARGLKRKAKKE